MKRQSEERKEAIKAAARGRWREILTTLGGIPAEVLDGKHHGCPQCGGVDRFRAIDLDVGGLYCNQCFSEHNGDGLAALQWARQWDFPTTLRKLAEYLGIETIQPTDGKRAAKRDKVPLIEQAHLIADVGYLAVRNAEKLAEWCSRKPPTTPKGAGRLGTRIYTWNGFDCIGFEGRQPDRDQVQMVSLFRVDGEMFPPWEKLTARKAHNLGPNAWLYGDPEALASATTVLVPEGPSDAAALLSFELPDGWAVITSTNGAEATGGLDFAWAHGKRIIVLRDHDLAGEKGGQRFSQAFLRAGAAAVHVPKLWPEDAPKGADVRDWLLAGHGVADLVAAVENCPAEAAGKPLILLDVDETRVIDEAIEVLTEQPLFQRGGSLVQITRDGNPPPGVVRPANCPHIAIVRHARIRELLARGADWAKAESKSEPKPCHPGDWVISGIMARGQWQLIRPLEAICEWPVLRRDGSVLDTPGYDQQTGLWYEPSESLPSVPPNPTPEDARRAAEQLLAVVCDFPFAAPEHRSAWLAALLTPLARHAFRGPAPLNLIDANAPGCGKGLLANVTGMIVAGREMATTTLAAAEDERKKCLTSLALAADPLILFDNVAGLVDSPNLNAMLTTNTWSDRILGVSEMTGSLPFTATVYMTANNVSLGGDTVRRTLHIRLEANCERPEERSGFQIPALLPWVREHRPELLTSALTILRAYCVAGRPDLHLSHWGSYEGWSDLVRASVIFAGQADPAGTRKELSEHGNQELGALRRLLSAWQQLDPEKCGLTAGEILKAPGSGAGSTLWAQSEAHDEVLAAIMELASGRNGKLPSPKSLGWALRKYRRRIVGDLYLDCRPVRIKGTQRWYVAELAPVVSAVSAVSAVFQQRNSQIQTEQREERENRYPGGSLAKTAETAGTAGVGGPCPRPGCVGLLIYPDHRNSQWHWVCHLCGHDGGVATDQAAAQAEHQKMKGAAP